MPGLRTTRGRSRRGCRTCKVRRVKCDEVKPVCIKCQSTGRVCDGYGIWGGGNDYANRRTTAAIAGPGALARYNTPSPFSGGDEERAYFDFFRERTAQKLSGVFASTFWDTVVLQASFSEPAVIHAAIALVSFQRPGCLENTYSAARTSPPLPAQPDPGNFALEQYNKAIRHLQQHFAANDHRSMQVALITCMIFICIELSRGEFGAASTHLENGLRIVRTTQAQARSKKGHGRQKKAAVFLQPEPHSQSVDDSLAEVFTRLKLQSAFLGHDPRFLDTVVVPEDSYGRPGFVHVPSTFRSIYEARIHLEGLLNAIVHLEQSHRTGNNDTSLPSLHEQQSQLKTSLLTWQAVYGEYSSSANIAASSSLREGLGHHLLFVYHTMATIMVSTALRPPGAEMIFDEYTAFFTFLITQVQRLVHLSKLPLTEPGVSSCVNGDHHSLIIDMGFIPPVYYAAIKCRVPQIRRRAVRLLGASPHQEGMWDGTLVAGLADKVVQLEEGGFFTDSAATAAARMIPDDTFPFGPWDISTVEQENRDAGIPTLPESSRFHEVNLVMGDSVKRRGTVVCRRQKSSGYTGNWDVVEHAFEFDGAHVRFHP